MSTELPISSLTLDSDIQCRECMDEDVVASYAEDLKREVVFPPVEVITDGDMYWLVDGFHRVSAAQKVGHDTIAAEVKNGTYEDAVLASCRANQTHGLRRTNADKRRAITRALELRGEWSDSSIAEWCGVSCTTVGTVRRSLSKLESENPRTYTTKYGTTARMNTAKIGRSPGRSQDESSASWVRESEPEDSPRRMSAYAIGSLQRIDLADPLGVTEMRRVKAWIDQQLDKIQQVEGQPRSTIPLITL